MAIGDYFTPGGTSKRNSRRNSKSPGNSQLPEPEKPSELSPPVSPWQSQFNTDGSPGGSKFNSRPTSLYPAGDFRNSTIEEINDIKCEVMVNWLHSQQEEKLWTAGEDEEGVVLKKSRGMYTCSPADLADEPAGFFQAVQALNVKVAMTVNTRVIRILLHSNQMPFIEIKEGLRLQVLPDISFLPRCQKHQFAAFIADSGLLVVWDDDPKKILDRVEQLETDLMKMIWGNEDGYPAEEKEDDEKKEALKVEMAEFDGDVEDQPVQTQRPIALWQAICTAFSVALTIATLGLGWRQVAIQSSIDHTYLRVLIVVAALPLFWLALVRLLNRFQADCSHRLVLLPVHGG